MPAEAPLPIAEIQQQRSARVDSIMGTENTIPACEIFPSDSDFDNDIDDAINSGTIEIFPKADFRVDDCDAFVTAGIEIDETDAQNAGLDFDQLPGYIGDDGEIYEVLSSTESVSEKEVEAIKRAISRGVKVQDAWFLADSTIKKEIESGAVSQMFRVDLGEDTGIDIVNLTNNLLDDALIDQMRESLLMMFNATGGNLKKALKAIAILPPSSFGGYNVATSLAETGTIKINSILLDPEMLAEFTKGYDTKGLLGAKSYYQATLVHEMMHLVECLQSDYSSNKFRNRLGWTGPQVDNFVDDYGNVVSKVKSKLYLPSKNQEVRDVGSNSKSEVDTVEHFGVDAYLEAKPVSAYGYVDAREDLADASVAYFFMPELLDKIRQNAISNILHEVKGGEVLDEIDIAPVKLDEFKQKEYIKPRKIGVKSIYTKKSGNQQSAYGYSGNSIGVIDDYGNVVEHKYVWKPRK